MGLVSRDAILKAADIKTQDIDVPEWGGMVRIAAMNGLVREQYESAFIKIQGTDDPTIRATLVVFSVVDDKGALMFTVDDVDELNQKSCKALEKLFEAARKLNGMDKSFEDQVKN